MTAHHQWTHAVPARGQVDGARVMPRVAAVLAFPLTSDGER
jgi:hypothetical protein